MQNYRYIIFRRKQWGKYFLKSACPFNQCLNTCIMISYYHFQGNAKKIMRITLYFKSDYKFIFCSKLHQSEQTLPQQKRRSHNLDRKLKVH